MRGLPTDIARLLNEAAVRHDVDAELIRAVAWVESRGKAGAVSKAGAMGVMQLMPRTAKGLSVSDPFDPAQNIEGGVRYLAGLLERFDDVSKALAGYNWGPSRVARGSDWPSSVQGYVRKVLARQRIEAGSGEDDGTVEDDAPFDDADAAVWLQNAAKAVDWFRGRVQSFLPQPLPHCRSCTCSEESVDDEESRS